MSVSWMPGPGSIWRGEKKSSMRCMEPKTKKQNKQNQTLQGGPVKGTLISHGPMTWNTDKRAEVWASYKEVQTL